MRFPVSQAVFLSLLASSQLVQGFQPGVEARDLEKKYVGSPSTLASRWAQLVSSIDARHHTEAQIAAKEAAAAKNAKNGKRDPHHTEAQIAAKEAAAAKASKNGKRDPHHTEAQIAAKEAAAKGKATNSTATTKTHHHKGAKDKDAANAKREPQEADEFGPWDTTEDEFGSWVDKRDPHHTEAQIAAKEAAAAKKNSKTNKREAHHTEAQIAAKEAAAAKKAANTKPKREPEPQEADEFGPWDTTEDEFGSWVDKREAHHTEAQIAAKEAAAAKKNAHNKREAHHTEAQIAAKEAAAAKKAANHKREASPQEADEFGPWDTTEDEFGSWVDKREPHHTEAQIAAKKAAAAKKAGKPKREASPQEADEFGPWDTTEDEFGSWVDKREAHHTEAQIAAKKAAAKKKGTNA
ncbi:uncharacterized protein BHQ10_009528 [Talaromyces amestolkiae]|uniref:Uncharacterized protein n=1 Tax=Talaromyces amestolkiae TaxID=1196081 RepID=A0A364LCH9_TALAM|nr:uncharacterized protein BHQ10_009528 [Talaromyces amestolkiae]RAO73516.1 hypothetical protein BHQ10_009528 [Talaromyces amestolkiae]